MGLVQTTSPLVFQWYTDQPCHPSCPVLLPSRCKGTGRGLLVWHNQRSLIFFSLYNCLIIKRKFLWSFRELLCRKPPLQASFGKPGQSMGQSLQAACTGTHQACSWVQPSLPAGGDGICWSMYLGSTWCRWKYNTELNNNLARSSQSWLYLFIFN